MFSHEILRAPPTPRPEWTENELAQEALITNGHVVAMTARLSGHVQQQLEAECAAQVVTETWINAAYNELSAYIDPQDKDHQNDLAQARQDAAASLRKDLVQETNLIPMPEEIQAHTRELAQCVVSNWVSQIKASYRRALRANTADGKVLILNSDWLPKDGSNDSVVRGLSKFAADTTFVLQALHEYLAEKTTDDSPFPISARLALTTVGQEHQIVSSNEVIKPNQQSVQNVVEEIVRLSTVEVPSSVALSQVELQAGLCAARVAGASINAPEPSFPDRLPAGEQRLVRDVAEYFVKAYTAFLVPTSSENSPRSSLHQASSSPRNSQRSHAAMIKERDALKLRFKKATGQSWTSCHRISTVAMVYASAIQHGIMDLSGNEEIPNSGDEHPGNSTDTTLAANRVIVAIAGYAARHAVNSPNSPFLESQLNARVTHEIFGQTTW